MIAYGRALGIDSLPNRLFEYLAAGLAILAPSYAVEIAAIVDDDRVGVLIDFEDPQAVVKAFIWLEENPQEVRAMGDRAREAFLAKYNWDVEADRLVDRMRELERR
jgi:glycosyltransferase involved in cell wall biosynthesis